MVRRALALSPSLYAALDQQGRTAYERAPLEMRRVMDSAVQFCGRYKITSVTPEHQSSTCLVYRALDLQAGEGEEGAVEGAAAPGVGPAPVVLKLMRNRDQFERERDARVGLDHQYVAQVLATSDDKGLPERWKADAEVRGWAGCVQGFVMEAGDRPHAYVGAAAGADDPRLRRARP